MLHPLSTATLQVLIVTAAFRNTQIGQQTNLGKPAENHSAGLSAELAINDATPSRSAMTNAILRDVLSIRSKDGFFRSSGLHHQQIRLLRAIRPM
jgi:hypothetical protein